MSKPVKSISVSQENMEAFNRREAEVLEFAGTKESAEKFSTLVQKLIVDSLLLDTRGLQEFAAREGKTNRDKYIVISIV